MMWLTKLAKLTVAAVLIAGLLGGGWMARSVLADKPSAAKSDDAKSPKDAATQGAKDKKPQGPSVHGIIDKVEGDKLTIIVRPDPNTKQTESKTFTVAKDARVTLEERFEKGQPPIEGKLADLTPGTNVNLQLSENKETVIGIAASGAGLTGYIASTNGATRTLTIRSKNKNGPTETTVTLPAEAKVLLSDGLSKDEPPREGGLADLTEGTPVHVQLAVDRKLALGVHVQGISFNGTLKSYDSGAGVLIVTVKEEGGIVDKTLTTAKNAQLLDLEPGGQVQVRLSVFDKDKVVSAHGVKNK